MFLFNICPWYESKSRYVKTFLNFRKRVSGRKKKINEGSVRVESRKAGTRVAVLLIHLLRYCFKSHLVRVSTCLASCSIFEFYTLEQETSSRLFLKTLPFSLYPLVVLRCLFQFNTYKLIMLR